MIIGYLKKALAGMFLAAGISGAAVAIDYSAMTDTERAAFGAAVRAYLLENPEVIMEVVAVLEQRQQAAEATRDVDLVTANLDALHNDGFSWVGGNPDGDITIVEFLDYRCGFCKRAHPVIAELLEADSNIRLIVKEFPILGEESVTASRFAISVKQIYGDEAYKNVGDALMLMRANVNDESLAGIAADHDLDFEEITARMGDESVTKAIGDTRLLGQRMQISGTPSFVVGTHLLRGFLPLEGMQEIVAGERG